MSEVANGVAAGEPGLKRRKTAVAAGADAMDTTAVHVAFTDRARAAILGAHVGDALAFPFHWYYSYNILQQHMDKYYKQDSHGWVHGFQQVHEELKFKHPDSFKYFRLASFWSLSNIVQDHDRCNDNRTAWATKGTHYHHNLRPGETTITVQLCRLLLQSLNESKGYDYEHYLQGYAKYFEAPRQHRDTYIEVPHQFFMHKRAQILAKDCKSHASLTNVRQSY